MRMGSGTIGSGTKIADKIKMSQLSASQAVRRLIFPSFPNWDTINIDLANNMATCAFLDVSIGGGYPCLAVLL